MYDVKRLSPKVGAIVRRLREAKDWTQGELASASSVSKVTISRLERDEREPEVSTLRAVASALGVSIDQLRQQVDINQLSPAQHESTAQDDAGEPPWMRQLNSLTEALLNQQQLSAEQQRLFSNVLEQKDSEHRRALKELDELKREMRRLQLATGPKHAVGSS